MKPGVPVRPASARLLAAFLVALIAAATPAAAGRSPWSPTNGAKLRLVSPGGPPAADGSLIAAIEIALEPGWKTYWRHPGESGIAPEFDFGGSQNLAGATVSYPAPHRFDDGGSMSAGYAGTVVLPVRVRPETPALPVMLDVRVTYGACKELCVPASGEARLMVSAATAPDPEAAALLAAADAAVPRRGDPAGPLAVTAVEPDPEAAGAVLVTGRLADPEAPADLFAEGPGDGFPPLPRLVSRDGAAVTWRVTLDRRRPGAPGEPIRLTLVNGAAAVEVERPLP
jgi:DsbC/DsbD-like thiol-disulfide interchange protein